MPPAQGEHLEGRSKPRLNIITIMIILLMLAASRVYYPLCHAQGVGVGVSGTFYRFNYTLPAGSSISSPDIYIYITNQGRKTLNITLETTVRPSTPFIRLVFSENNFTLRPGEHKTVYIRIVALEGAAPGTYEVYADVVAYHEEEGAVIPVPVGSQRANVTVTGESANVTITTVNPMGEPVRAEIRLVRVTPKANYTVAYTRNGTLEARVAPGKYAAIAYLGGHILNQTVFSLAPGEHREIHLIVSTVYFSYFSAAPALDSEGRIGFVQLVGVINNLYMPITDARLELQVYFNGEPLENVTIASTPLLPKGKSEYRYNYIPSTGWKPGRYAFRLVLYSKGIIIAESPEQEVVVTSSMIGARPEKRHIPWWIIILLVIILLIIIYIYYRRRRVREAPGGLRRD